MGKKKTYQVNKVDRSQQHKRVDVFRTLQVPSNQDRLYPNLSREYTNSTFVSSTPNLPGDSSSHNRPIQSVWSTASTHHRNNNNTKKFSKPTSRSKKVCIAASISLVVILILAAVVGVALYFTLFHKPSKCNRECVTNEYCAYNDSSNRNPVCSCKPGYVNQTNSCKRTSQTKCFLNYEPYTYLNTKSPQSPPAPYETRFLSPFCCPNSNYFTSACCGVSSSNYSLQTSKRIIGGSALQQGVFPWLVYVTQVYRYTANSSLHLVKNCTGALLNDMYVLTAAHCLDREDDVKFNAEFGTIESMMRVYYGFVDKSRISSANERKIKRVIVHPKYDAMFLLNDLALLRLDKPLNRSLNVDYLCLFNYANADSIVQGLKLYVAGWGSTSANHLSLIYPQVINYVDAIVFPMSFCTYIYPEKQYAFLFNASTHVCAGYQESAGKDTCYADSGAPLMVKLNEQWFAYGVVSFGSQPDCAKGPSMFTRVNFYSDWIKSIIWT